jgi:hypothetical protein
MPGWLLDCIKRKHREGGPRRKGSYPRRDPLLPFSAPYQVQCDLCQRVFFAQVPIPPDPPGPTPLPKPVNLGALGSPVGGGRGRSASSHLVQNRVRPSAPQTGGKA